MQNEAPLSRLNEARKCTASSLLPPLFLLRPLLLLPGVASVPNQPKRLKWQEKKTKNQQNECWGWLAATKTDWKGGRAEVWGATGGLQRMTRPIFLLLLLLLLRALTQLPMQQQNKRLLPPKPTVNSTSCISQTSIGSCCCNGGLCTPPCGAGAVAAAAAAVFAAIATAVPGCSILKKNNTRL